SCARFRSCTASFAIASQIVLSSGCFNPEADAEGSGSTDTMATSGESTSSATASTSMSTATVSTTMTSASSGAGVCGDSIVETGEACDDPQDPACVDCQWRETTGSSTGAGVGEGSTSADEGVPGTESEGTTEDTGTTTESDAVA